MANLATTSAPDQQRHFRRFIRMSALSPLASRWRTCPDGRKVPLGDIADQLFNHLVSPDQQCWGHRNANRISGLEVDHQLERGRLFDRDVGNLGAPKEFDDLLGHYLYKELAKTRTVGGKAAFFRHFRKVIDRGQAQ